MRRPAALRPLINGGSGREVVPEFAEVEVAVLRPRKGAGRRARVTTSTTPVSTSGPRQLVGLPTLPRRSPQRRFPGSTPRRVPASLIPHMPRFNL